jgi:type IV secretion system protein VirB6
MAGLCALDTDDAGLVAGLTSTVDCNVQALVQAGYGALVRSGSPVMTALTILLTIYVAVLGLQLMFGRSPLKVGDVTLNLFKIAIVVTFATSWATYQQLVFDTLVHGPEQIGALILHGLGQPGNTGPSSLYIDLQAAYDELQRGALYYSQRGVPVASPLQGGSAFAALSLNLSALMLIMTTLGLLLTAKIVLSLLLALGPVFFIFLLFDATRGLFQGWLSAAIGFAFVPLLAALGLAVQLALLGPQLDVLGHVMARNAVDLAPPTSIFALSMIFAMVSAALTVAVAMIALGLRRSARQRDPAAATERAEKIYKSHTTDLDALRPVGSRAPDRASQIAGAAAAAMSRRELRTTEATLVSRTPAVARPGGTSADIAIQGRTNPGQRRSAQPRRSAANLRRDL